MQKIKFKVWDTVRRKMYKPLGITFDAKSQEPFAVKVPGRSWEPVGKFQLLLWTCLCDSNNVDIYEGDYIKISSAVYEVKWDDELAKYELYEISGSSRRDIIDAASGTVIGNRFESHDALKNR